MPWGPDSRPSFPGSPATFPWFPPAQCGLDSGAPGPDDAGGGARPAAFGEPPGPNPERGIGAMNKWVLAAILAAIAVFMYASSFIKMGG